MLDQGNQIHFWNYIIWYYKYGKLNGHMAYAFEVSKVEVEENFGLIKM